MMKGLEGKVALITGGGKGIGRGIALALAARGVRVVVTGRDERALGETVGEIAYGGGKARHLAGDVRDASHVSAAVERAIEVFGGLDIVIASAGQSGPVDLGADLARADAILSTNLLGTYQTFDAAARRMKGPGRLVATAACSVIGGGGQAAVRASRAGVVALVREAALELAPRKITCNAVVPGWVDSDASERRLAQLAELAAASAHPGTKTKDEVRAEAVAAFPLGRFLQPEEVAELVVFLCSSASDGITGQAIAIGAGPLVPGA